MPRPDWRKESFNRDTSQQTSQNEATPAPTHQSGWDTLRDVPEPTPYKSTFEDSKPPVLNRPETPESQVSSSPDKPKLTIPADFRAQIERDKGIQLTENQCAEIVRYKELVDSYKRKVEIQERGRHGNDKDRLYAELFGELTPEEVKFEELLKKGMETNSLPFEMHQALIWARIEKQKAEDAKKREQMLDQASQVVAQSYAESAQAHREAVRKEIDRSFPAEPPKPTDDTKPKGGFFSRFRKK